MKGDQHLEDVEASLHKRSNIVENIIERAKFTISHKYKGCDIAEFGNVAKAHQKKESSPK